MQLTEPLQAGTRKFPNYPMKNRHNTYLKKTENNEVNKEEISTDEIKNNEFRIQWKEGTKITSMIIKFSSDCQTLKIHNYGSTQ